MTPTDEIREAVADSLHAESFTRAEALAEADRIIRMVVDACARIGPDAVKTLGLPEEPQYEGDVRHIERRAVLGYSDRIRALAPEPGNEKGRPLAPGGVAARDALIIEQPVSDHNQEPAP